MIRLLFGLLLFAGCARFQHIDQGRLNHPAMDLNSPLVPGSSRYLTTMDIDGKGVGNQSCSVCAK